MHLKRKTPSYIFPLLVIAMLFFVFGFLTWINGILIPYFQICMELNNFQATLVAFSSYLAYFVMAFPSAIVLKRTGYKNGMVVGLILMAAGTLLFIPAAYSRVYIVFLTGLFITASGLTLIQTAVNPYVARIGPIEGTAQRIAFMGIANKTAGIISLAVLGKIFLINADSLVAQISTLDLVEKAKALDAFALKIVNPYIIITIVLLAVAVLVYFSGLPEIDDSETDDQGIGASQARPNIFHYPYLILGVLALFVSMACETIPIDGIILYSRSLGVPMEVARHFSTWTLYIMLFGYLFVTITVPKYLSQNVAMKIASIFGLVFTAAAFLAPGMYSIYSLMLLGFSASMLWGTIWGLSMRNLGIHTKKGSAILLMSVIGGGVFPVIFGKLLDLYPVNPNISILILVPCYLYLLYYSSLGFKIENWRRIS